MTQGILITGPQGCGKTRYAKELAAHYGKTKIMDDWEPGTRIPSDTIAFTHHDYNGMHPSIQFEDAMAAAGLLADSNQPRFCKDCVHSEMTQGTKFMRNEYFCNHPKTHGLCLVTGHYRMSCETIRKYRSTECAPEGKLFAPKLSDSV